MSNKVLQIAAMVTVLASILSTERGEASALDCSPVGEFVHIGLLSSSSVSFVDVVGKPVISTASINSTACARLSATTTPDSYRRLQELGASADPAIVTLTRPKSIQSESCFLSASNADVFLDQKWRFEEDGCVQPPLELVKMISLDGRKTLYVNKEFQLLISRRSPANFKKKQIK